MWFYIFALTILKCFEHLTWLYRFIPCEVGYSACEFGSAVIDNKKVVSFKSEKAMQDFILKRLKSFGIPKTKVYFSDSKETI